MATKKTTDPAKVKLQARTEEILRMTSEFCLAHLDHEYSRLCEKLVLKLSRKRASPIVTGSTAIWAASVIYALGQINFLFDKSQKPHVNQVAIAEHFGTTVSTLGGKAKAIRAMFKLRYWDPEFSTGSVASRNPLAGMVMIDGMIVPISLLDQLTERPPREV